MTFYYETNSWTSQPQPNQNQVELWNHISDKANWRIVQLPNGYYQTEWKDNKDSWISVTRRETVEGAEEAIESSIKHYAKKLKLTEGPIVVKTFE